jgi:hypothetical protein
MFLNFIGEEIDVAYYFDPEGAPEPGSCLKNGTRYFFNAPIDTQQYHWCNRTITELANRYESTGEDAYARRAALLLDRFAQNYKHYLIHRGRGRGYYVSTGGPCMVNGKRVGTPGEDLPYNWIDCRLLKCWISELNLKFVEAYSTIEKSPALDELNRELGVDVRRRIKQDLISEMCDFMLQVPWKYQMSNNLPTLSWIAQAGRALDEPRYVHYAYRYLNEIITNYGKDRGIAGYTFDLHNPEGNQCHYGMRSAFEKTFKSIESWSDPPGYVDEVDGKHLENLSFEKDFPLVRMSACVPDVYRLPNGDLNPIHDAMGHKGQGGDVGPLPESRCRLLPGFGQALLGDGRGTEQVQVQLHYSTDNANHCHQDCLSLVWYAHGRMMSGDIGYQRNKLRSWASGTLSHNTVVVDRDNQTGGDTFGNLLYYVPDLPGVSMIQVDSPRAYEAKGATLYRRTVILNTVDIRKPYFIDIFEVRGGKQHDYSIHGSLLGDMTGSTSLSMRPMLDERPLLDAGEVWREPKGMGGFNHYGLFKNVKQAAAMKDFYVDFAYTDATDIGTRIHMLRDERIKVFLAQTPGLRKAGHYKDDLVYKWQMPHLLARIDSTAGNPSVFVAVYDLYSGGPKISEVKRLGQDRDMVALKVSMDGRSDTLLYSFGDSRAMKIGGIETDGKLAMVVEKDNKAKGYLVSGTYLRGGQIRLSSPQPEYSGVLAGASRKLDGADSDAFDTLVDLPTGTELRGKWLVVIHGRITSRYGHSVQVDAQGIDGIYGQVTHAYEIDHVEERGNTTRIHLTHDHGLRIEGDRATEVFSMWRTFEGQERFVVYTNAATVVRSPNSQ